MNHVGHRDVLYKDHLHTKRHTEPMYYTSKNLDKIPHFLAHVRHTECGHPYLQFCEVSLPAEVLLVLGAQGRDEIIPVMVGFLRDVLMVGATLVSIKG